MQEATLTRDLVMRGVTDADGNRISLSSGHVSIPPVIKVYGVLREVTSIDALAFAGADMLRSVTIPSTVLAIGPNAFTQCRRLESVTIGDGVQSIGHGCFYNCQSLEEISFPKSLAEVPRACCSACRSLRDVSISEGVKAISDWAFSDCQSLQSLRLPSTIASLADDFLAGCDSLTELTVPESAHAEGNAYRGTDPNTLRISPTTAQPSPTLRDAQQLGRRQAAVAQHDRPTPAPTHVSQRR